LSYSTYANEEEITAFPQLTKEDKSRDKKRLIKQESFKLSLEVTKKKKKGNEMYAIIEKSTFRVVTH